MKKFEKFIIRGGGEKLLFQNNGPECLFMLYLTSYLIMCGDIFQRYGLDNRYMGI